MSDFPSIMLVTLRKLSSLLDAFPNVAENKNISLSASDTELKESLGFFFFGWVCCTYKSKPVFVSGPGMLIVTVNRCQSYSHTMLKYSKKKVKTKQLKVIHVSTGHSKNTLKSMKQI